MILVNRKRKRLSGVCPGIERTDRQEFPTQNLGYPFVFLTFFSDIRSRTSSNLTNLNMSLTGHKLARRLGAGILIFASATAVHTALSFPPGADEADCTPDLKGSQYVLRLPQETKWWCWAASGQMCMAFFNVEAPQCEQANKRFNLKTCCDNPVDSDCNNGGWPEFDKYDFSFKTTSDKALSWDELTDQIYCKKKPVAFSWHYVGKGGHMMVAYGYEIIDGARFVLIHDPRPMGQGETRRISYDEYVESEDHHTHWDDFYDIAKK